MATASLRSGRCSPKDCRPHSVMPVQGGAYVCSATEFLFLADTDGDDREDKRRVVFFGFGNADVHHMIHALRWAPWGELYFNQSIYINSFIDTRWGKRRLNGSGLWRFRPETERLEVFARGTVNPWGHAIDRWGQSFITDGAGGQGRTSPSPGCVSECRRRAPHPARPRAGKPNGTGCEALSGRHFPEEWRSIVEMIRANRTVRYRITDKGSGFAAQEVETLVRSIPQDLPPGRSQGRPRWCALHRRLVQRDHRPRRGRLSPPVTRQGARPHLATHSQEPAAGRAAPHPRCPGRYAFGSPKSPRTTPAPRPSANWPPDRTPRCCLN